MSHPTNKMVLKLQAELCKALADPNRLLIIKFLNEGEANVSQLVEMVGIKQANLSRHLSVLRHAGLVDYRKEGNTVIYHLVDPRLPEACEIVYQILVEQLQSQQRLSDLI